ncbi:FUSC family membrane protein [Hymenobacter latericus]|uniref:FUSC family membrane protein n=1 Tax=Hymenobacter sp. YIM 151858-1 TaxID=2987688 RepID=UPI00222641D8|nr:FUSC family membrane protein [Hymenobacter sp. YIM 151858-1]UYZ58974.1 FUSC family protein [Hymenobacter sp. YIM 151858-1]
MRKHERTLQYFFFGQDFADGLRVALSILLPGLTLAQLGHFDLGLTVSLGAVCASLPDLPGPIAHKRNGLLVCNLLVFAVALLTGVARMHVLALGAEIVALSFLFTLVSVYGVRAGAIGSAGLLILILTMDRDLGPAQLLPYGLLVLAGGLWYTLVALLAYHVQPYRPAQRALGECIHAIAEYFRLKAEFYDPETSLEQDYRALLKQQVVVTEKQDAAREMLFKTRQIVQDTTGSGRRLVLTFVDAMDLYEQVVAAYYDYASLRQRFNHTGVLADVARLIRRMATELDHLGLAIQSNRPYAHHSDRTAELEQLKARIDRIGEQEPGSNLVLRKLLVNLRNLHQRLADITRYADPEYRAPLAPRAGESDYSRFVSRQSLSPALLRDNLTISSATFRHALRVTVAAIVSFGVAKLLNYGHHGYWIMLTAVYMLKPGFSLTKERNLQRVSGTLLGGVLGVAVLYLVPSEVLQFGFLLVFMIVAYSFQRRSYMVMVLFLTPYVLILFHFLGIQYVSAAGERVLDTLIGCAIALTTSYLLLPRWESEQLGTYMRDVLRANRNYLHRLADYLAGGNLSAMDYKLARKEVYVSSSNLAAAFQRMLSEPKHKQRHEAEVHQFVVLNLILSSNIATLASAARANALPAVPPEGVKPLRQSLALLSESLRKVSPDTALPELPPLPGALGAEAKPAPTAEEKLLLEQLDFVQKVSADIRKVTDAVAP